MIVCWRAKKTNSNTKTVEDDEEITSSSDSEPEKDQADKAVDQCNTEIETDLLEDRNSAFEKFRLNYINLLHIILFNGNHLIFSLTSRYLFRLMEIDTRIVKNEVGVDQVILSVGVPYFN